MNIEKLIEEIKKLEKKANCFEQIKLYLNNKLLHKKEITIQEIILFVNNLDEK